MVIHTLSILENIKKNQFFLVSVPFFMITLEVQELLTKKPTIRKHIMIKNAHNFSIIRLVLVVIIGTARGLVSAR